MTDTEIPEDERLVRRDEIRRVVPVHDRTLLRMEKRGDFPRRIYLSKTCVVWKWSQVQAWLASQGQGQGVA